MIASPLSDVLEAEERQKAKGTIADAVERIRDDAARLMDVVQIADY